MPTRLLTTAPDSVTFSFLDPAPLSHSQANAEISEHLPFRRGVLGALESQVAEAVLAASGDVTMVIDPDGKICDIAASREMAREGADGWLDRRWADTVAADSRHKVQELLKDASLNGRTRWREINQTTPNNDPISLRYVAVNAGHDGHIIAIGRDERVTNRLQQRLVEAQQTMERDYTRLRDVEFRYRLLFQMSGEAIIIVDAATKRIVEANPAAEQLIGPAHAHPFGEVFSRLFDPASQDDAASLLSLAQSRPQASHIEMRLLCEGRPLVASASVFRQERATQFLVRLSGAGSIEPASVNPTDHLERVLEKIPDAFVLVDEDQRILTANSAFLHLVRLGSTTQIEGQPLNRFVGRAGLERDILIDNIRAHGMIKNFSTTVRTQVGESEDVEVSGVFANPDSHAPCYGLTLRTVSRMAPDRNVGRPGQSRSVEQLTELVGKLTLKELVRESTDLVERLCIEAALELTRNNRASAADLLGLSRQGLYTKLHKFGLGNLTSDN